MKSETVEKIEHVMRVGQDLVTLSRQDPNNDANFDILGAMTKMENLICEAVDLETDGQRPVAFKIPGGKYKAGDEIKVEVGDQQRSGPVGQAIPDAALKPAEDTEKKEEKHEDEGPEF